MTYFIPTNHKNIAILLATLTSIIVLFSSCSSSKKAYRPAKKKNKGCDCSHWSYNVNTKTTYVA